MARQQGSPAQVWFVTAVLTALAVGTLIPMAQADETESTSVSEDGRGEIGTMTHTLYCERTGSQDKCSDSKISEFHAGHYNIGWCPSAPCQGFDEPTDGTIDMLRTDDAFAWCVQISNGHHTTSCQATFGDTSDLYVGNVATFSHPIDGWFDGEMRA